MSSGVARCRTAPPSRPSSRVDALDDVERLGVEVREDLAVLDDRRHAGDPAPADLRLQARRVHEVLLRERHHRGRGEVGLLEAGLGLRVGVAVAHDGGVEPDPGREEEAPAVDERHVDAPHAPVVGQPQDVLGRVDEVAGDADDLREDVRRAAGQASSATSEPMRPLADLVDGPVAAEGDDGVEALPAAARASSIAWPWRCVSTAAIS